MNTWTPLEEHELLDMINQAWERMNLPQRRLWDAIKIEPQKWQLDPWGKEGNQASFHGGARGNGGLEYKN